MQPTILGNYGYHIRPRDWREKVDKTHPVVSEAHSRFDVAKFAETKKPLVIGEVYDTKKFSTPHKFPTGLNIIDSQIKVTYGSVYYIPKELDQFSETIARIVSFEHTINPYHAQYYAYLTVIQGMVEANKTQRADIHLGHCFIDHAKHLGHKMDKRPITRSYVIYDRVPDIFYCQKWKLSGKSPLDPSQHSVYADRGIFSHYIEDQVSEEAAIVFDRYSIIAHDIYAVCRETTVDYPVFRTYFKLTFDTFKRELYSNETLGTFY